MTDDRAKYLEIFRAEAREHLDSLSRGLLHLEEAPDDTEGLKELLRNAHTLKGSSRLLGLAAIGELAHKMEDLLKALERRTLAVGGGAVDLLLEGTDTMRAAVDSLGTARPEPDTADLRGRLEAALAPAAAKPAAPDLGAALSGLFDGDEAPPPLPRRAAPTAAAPDTDALPVPAPPVPVRPTHDALAPVMRETMRVEVARIDELSDLAGELNIARSRVENRLFTLRRLLRSAQDLVRQANRPATDRVRELEALLMGDTRRTDEELGNDMSVLEQLAGDFQTQSMALRMLPVALLFEPYHRTVRDLRRQLGKEVELRLSGTETKLDRQLLQAINPALLHLVRNCVDHGIEPPPERAAAGKPAQAHIDLRAYQKGANVLIEVQDDGRGLDPARIRATAVAKRLLAADEAAKLGDRESLELIFRHGFSTSRIITDVSGRGLGMSVVWSTLKELKGDVRVESEPGRWTRFTLAVPLTLSTAMSLLVRVGGAIVAIPSSFVLSTLLVERSALQVEGGTTVLRAHDRVIPVIDSARFLELPGSNGGAPRAKVTVVVVQLRDELLGLMVDDVLRFQEVVVKSLGHWLQRVRLVSGATILRQGDPALILNVFDVFQDARHRGALAQPAAGPGPRRRRRLLVVDDSITTRTIEKSILEANGYLVDTASSGEEALRAVAQRQYDLVVSDVEMPGISGFELCANLRAQPAYRETPVVIVTSLAREEDKERGVRAGANAYIVKGTFKQETLLDTIRSLLS